MNVRLLLTLPAALLVLLAPVATADAAKKKKRSVFPKITKIDPLNVAIGDTMTVRGRNFLRGRNRNTVVFKRPKQRAIFAKAVKSSRRRLQVVVPEKLRPFLKTQAEQPVPTKFRLRILAKRFGKRYTRARVSPTIAPTGRVTDVETPPPPPAPPAPADCDKDGVLDDVDIDDDNDHMSDAFEVSIGTEPCAWDTDGDTLSDYWEYESALDLNLRALPYPGKRPYPNPLDSDLNTDYDGDGMLAWQEHVMWVRYGNQGTYLNYSDGTQVSEPSSGLTDDRRDVDADGLPNWWEANGPMRREWWKEIYDQEILYPVVYADPDFLDPDSDGDGRRDGDDDLDHDGYSNKDELARGWSKLPDKYDATAEAQYRWVQPHNPCLPDPESITCSLHPPPLDKSWPPFKQLGTHNIPINDEYPRPLPLSLSPADIVEEPEPPTP